MLVLTRKLDESINIGDDIIVTVVGFQGDKVRLGITAPKAVPVHRREVYDRILAETGLGIIGPRPVPPPERLETDPRD